MDLELLTNISKAVGYADLFFLHGLFLVNLTDCVHSVTTSDGVGANWKEKLSSWTFRFQQESIGDFYKSIFRKDSDGLDKKYENLWRDSRGKYSD